MSAAKKGSKEEQALPFIAEPGDIAIVKAVKVNGRTRHFRRPIRVPVEKLHECQLILDAIERGPSSK